MFFFHLLKKGLIHIKTSKNTNHIDTVILQKKKILPFSWRSRAKSKLFPFHKGILNSTWYPDTIIFIVINNNSNQSSFFTTFPLITLSFLKLFLLAG